MRGARRIVPPDVEVTIEHIEKLQRAYSDAVGRDEARVDEVRSEVVAYIDALDPTLKTNPALDLTIRSTLAVMTDNWALLNPFEAPELTYWRSCGMALGIVWAAILAGPVIPVLITILSIQRWRRHT